VPGIGSLKHVGVEELFMKLVGQTLAILFILALAGTLGVAGYFALKFGVELFARMDFQVAAVTIMASAVMLLVAFAIARSIRQASRQKKAHQLFTEKTLAYQRFVDVWVCLLRQGDDAEDRHLSESSKELMALDRHLALYAGSKVLKLYAALRVLARESGSQHPDAKSQFIKALTEIRREFGLDTDDLTAHELQQLFFANADRASASTTVRAYHDLQPRVSLASNC
jgi:hypothetical protein